MERRSDTSTGLPTPISVEALIGLGPERLLDFVRDTPDNCVFDPAFSWLLLAEVVGVRVAMMSKAGDIAASRWAKVAAELYQGLVECCPPEEVLARSIWTRTAASFRQQASTPHFPQSANLASDVHPV